MSKDSAETGLIEKKFSIREMELLCDPSYETPVNADESTKKSAEEAKAYKYHLSKALADVFSFGTETVAADEVKAYKYKLNVSQYTHTPNPTPPDTSSIFSKIKALHETHAWWFTGIRLFLVRIGRILAKIGRAFLPAFFSIFGLSYGITAAINLALVFTITFESKLIKAELGGGRWKKLSSWKPAWLRFKGAIMENGRLYQILNDTVWFIVNLIVFCTSGPFYLIVNPILNLIGFAFDTVHESSWLAWDVQRYTRLINKIDQKIEKEEDEEELKTFSPDPPEADQNLLKDTNAETSEPTLNVNTLKYIRKQIEANRKEIVRRRAWVSFWTAMVLVGMVMLYFPPTTLPGAFLIGSGIAFGAGSVFTGLGRRIYLTVEKWIKDWRKTTPSNSPQPRPDSTVVITEALTPSTTSSTFNEISNVVTPAIVASSSNSNIPKLQRSSSQEKFLLSTPPPISHDSPLSSSLTNMRHN